MSRIAFALFVVLCTTVNNARGDGFNFNATNTARPLTAAERSTLENAIGNIFQPPPDSLPFQDDRGVWHKASCQTIGRDLADQLYDGHVGAESNPKGAGAMWTLPDSSKSTACDQMNVDPVTVGLAAGSAEWMRCLEACLVHEWYHKCQDTVDLRNNDKREEVAPFNLAAAYYCSTAVVPGDTNDPFTKNAKEWARYCQPQSAGPKLVRPINPRRSGDHFVFLKCDSVITGASDSLKALGPADGECHGYALAPFRGSDYVVIENPPFLPPGHSLVAICGGMMESGTARILTLDFYQGSVVGPLWWHDFGPPDYPPMFFYSMAQSGPDGQWYMLDTLNHQILRMEDTMFGDGIPDQISGVFASADWLGMEPLMAGRGIEAIIHPMMGPGVLLMADDVHFHELLYPYDQGYFLMDADGDLQADAILPLPLYEFLAFTPVIQAPLPWPGDNSLNLFAAWEHDIAVQRTDSTGEMIYEQLGMTHIGPGINGICPLIRPLLPGEYIMPMDMQTGLQPHPMMVEAPVPQGLVISVDPSVIIQLNWEEVPGAMHYAIYTSDDAVTFMDTGLRTTETCFEMPLSPMNKQFYRVTAIR
jgi:hypothetical protein